MISRTHSKGSPIESTSKTKINEILELLPDNVSGVITPKSLRDTIFSVWEGCPIKFTYSKSSPYIGLDRPDTKVKIFLGKRNFRGVDIMSDDILNSGADIILYNTKSDESENQNLEILLLSGDNPKLFNKSPRLKVNMIGDSFDVSIENPNGKISIKSSQEIDINGIVWPSSENLNRMIDMDSEVNSDDFTFVLVDNKYLHLKRSITNEPKFTSKIPVPNSIGGISAGRTFNDVPISEVLKELLYPSKSGTSEIIFLGSEKNNSIEKDDRSDIWIDFKYTLSRKNLDINKTIIQFGQNSFFVSKEGNSLVSEFDTESDFYDSLVIPHNKIIGQNSGKFYLKITSIDSEGLKDESVNFINLVYPYFFGFWESKVKGVSNLSKMISKLRKVVDIKTNQYVPIIGVGYFYFISPYPISKILNRGVDIMDSIESENGKLFSPDGKWDGVNYYIYTTKDKIEIDGFPQIWEFIT